MASEHSWTRKDLPDALLKALEVALDRGARVPTVLRMTEKAAYTDWALIISGRSDRNVRGITDGILSELSKQGRKPLGADGVEDYLWALLDFDDFLVHVFYHPVRTYYDLESMWNDVPRVDLELPAAVMSDSDLRQLDAPDPMPTFRGDMDFGGFEDEFDDDDDDGQASLLGKAPIAAPATADAPNKQDEGVEDTEGSNDDLFEP